MISMYSYSFLHSFNIGLRVLRKCSVFNKTGDDLEEGILLRIVHDS